jgi:hypothetical protein
MLTAIDETFLGPDTLSNAADSDGVSVLPDENISDGGSVITNESRMGCTNAATHAVSNTTPAPTPLWRVVISAAAMILCSVLETMASVLFSVAKALERATPTPEHDRTSQPESNGAQPTPTVSDRPQRFDPTSPQADTKRTRRPIKNARAAVVEACDLSRFNRLTIKELQAILRHRQCPTTMIKEDLVRRLASSYVAELQEMTDRQLRRVCRRHGILGGYSREELIRRVVEKLPGGIAGYAGYNAYRE